MAVPEIFKTESKFDKWWNSGRSAEELETERSDSTSPDRGTAMKHLYSLPARMLAHLDSLHASGRLTSRASWPAATTPTGRSGT